MVTKIGFIQDELGGLHDSKLVGIVFNGQTLEFHFDDLFSNYRGLAEYPVLVDYSGLMRFEGFDSICCQAQGALPFRISDVEHDPMTGEVSLVGGFGFWRIKGGTCAVLKRQGEKEIEVSEFCNRLNISFS